MTEILNTTFSYCCICCNINRHEILFVESVLHEEDFAATEYLTIKCRGCDNTSFREDYHDYMDVTQIGENDFVHSIIKKSYPAYIEKHKTLERAWSLPKPIYDVYFESLQAFKNDCKILTGAGFRAVIEAICLDKNIKGRNLEAKINNLSKEGLITKKECERLHSIRFLGNDSIHEMITPEKKQLKIVLTIIDHILKNLYIIDDEIGNTLERPINEFDEFKRLLTKKIKACNIGDDFPLAKYLDKDLRRIKENIVAFEIELKNEIQNNAFTLLAIGAEKPYLGSKVDIQHYVVVSR